MYDDKTHEKCEGGEKKKLVINIVVSKPKNSLEIECFASMKIKRDWNIEGGARYSILYSKNYPLLEEMS